MKFNKKTIGFIVLGFACIIWIITPLVGFFDLTGKQLAIFLPILIVLGEVLFLVSITLLGKEYWLKMKAFVKAKWRDLALYFKGKFNK